MWGWFKRGGPDLHQSGYMLICLQCAGITPHFARGMVADALHPHRVLRARNPFLPTRSFQRSFVSTAC